MTRAWGPQAAETLWGTGGFPGPHFLQSAESWCLGLGDALSPGCGTSGKLTISRTREHTLASAVAREEGTLELHLEI